MRYILFLFIILFSVQTNAQEITFDDSTKTINVTANVISLENYSIEKCLKKYYEFCEELIIPETYYCENNNCYLLTFSCIDKKYCLLNKEQL